MLSWIELLNANLTSDMNWKTRTNREKEKLQERGTKKFQERVAEEKEATEEIKSYDLGKQGELFDNDEHITFP